MDYKTAYHGHKSYTKKRLDKNAQPIEFRLTYDEWLQIWQKSGHLSERGHHKGEYCMSRIDDLGHYEAGNVFIQLFSDNVRQAQTGRTGYWKNKGCGSFSGRPHTEKTKEKLRNANLGKVYSDELKGKMTAHFIGKKQSPEQIAKRTAAANATRARKKSEKLNGRVKTAV